MMEYETVVSYVDERIQMAVATLRVGQWIVVNEDGFVRALTETRYCYPSKAAAIDEFASRCLDARRVRKIKRIGAGHYQYFVKDYDTGGDRNPVSIIRLTPRNIQFWQSGLQTALEEIRDECILPLYNNSLIEDKVLDDVIKNSVRMDIFDDHTSTSVTD